MLKIISYYELFPYFLYSISQHMSLSSDRYSQTLFEQKKPKCFSTEYYGSNQVATALVKITFGENKEAGENRVLLSRVLY